MEPKIVNRETITVLGVRARLVHMEEGVPEMWEKRFMAYHDRIAPLSTDGVYYGCAFATDRPDLYDYLAGMAVPPSTAVPEGLTLREIPGGPYVKIECTIATQDDAFDLVENQWLPASAYQKDQSRPTLDCYPPARRLPIRRCTSVFRSWTRPKGHSDGTPVRHQAAIFRVGLG